MLPTILITRPRPAADGFAAALRGQLGAEAAIVVSPLMRIEPLQGEVLPGAGELLILTSVNGVECLPSGTLEGRTAYAVGPATAAALRAAGARAQECGGNADALVARIIEDRPDVPMVHLRGEHARGEVAARLRAAGLDAREVVVYRQVAQPPTPAARALLEGDAPVLVPLFSPRSARLLAEAGRWRAPLSVLAMSRAVANEARSLGAAEILIAKEPDQAAMVEAVAAIWRGGSARDQLERIDPRQ